MKIWYLMSSPAGCPSSDAYVCSAHDSRDKAEKAIVALSAREDYHNDIGSVTDIDSAFEEKMCKTLEISIEEIVVQ